MTIKGVKLRFWITLRYVFGYVTVRYVFFERLRYVFLRLRFFPKNYVTFFLWELRFLHYVTLRYVTSRKSGP